MQVQELSKPQKAIPLVGAAALAFVAAANYHKTLEFIGVAGLLLTAANKAASYSSPQEALDDIAATAGKLGSLAGAAGKVLPKSPSFGGAKKPASPAQTVPAMQLSLDDQVGARAGVAGGRA